MARADTSVMRTRIPTIVTLAFLIAFGVLVASDGPNWVGQLCVLGIVISFIWLAISRARQRSA
jgi:hypothetical protein